MTFTGKPMYWRFSTHAVFPAIGGNHDTHKQLRPEAGSDRAAGTENLKACLE
jgi:hypothetical protein